MGADPFRIVQLTDLHLTAGDDDARSEPRLLGRLTGMNAAYGRLLGDPRVQGADLLLVTGDVTDRGDQAAWQVFWDGLAGAGLRPRCRVIPGNHDSCCLGMRPVATRRRRLAEDLARRRTGLAHGAQATELPWVEVLAGGRLALFGLDSCHPGNVSALTNAVGELGMPQLERLARLLRAHDGVPVKIVALHHSPNIPRVETARRRGLPVLDGLARWGHEVPAGDRRALRLLCLSHGVRLIVHGHLHREEDRRVNGVRIVGAPASTEPAREGGTACFRLLAYSFTSGRTVRVERLLVPAGDGERPRQGGTA